MSRNQNRGGADESAPDRQRLDKWLWFARVIRTREAAADLAESGHVRVNGQRAQSAARPVRLGDVLTISLDRRVLVLRVSAFAARREGYEQARLLYENIGDPPVDADLRD